MTVCLVGVGAIGRVHLRVLRALPGVDLVATVDPAGRADGAGVPHATSLEAALRGPGARADLVVVATPTDTHLDLVSRALAHGAALVLSEKPLTRDRAALDAFLAAHADAQARVRVVDHFGFGPEVEWGAGLVADRGWGAPRAALSSFTDPYGGRPAAELASYVSSWVDSGSNQLAVLSRFAPGWRVDERHEDAAGTRSVAQVAWEGGRGSLVATWHTGDSSKQTVLHWDDGRSLFLDHTSMTGTATDGGRVVEHLGHDASLDRKGAHYTGLYRALVRQPDHPLLALPAAVRIAAALATPPARAGAPRPDAAPAGTGPAWVMRTLG